MCMFLIPNTMNLSIKIENRRTFYIFEQKL